MRSTKMTIEMMTKKMTQMMLQPLVSASGSSEDISTVFTVSTGGFKRLLSSFDDVVVDCVT